MKCTLEMASDGMVHILSFRKFGSGIQVILKVLPQKLERLQCWYY
jgi:hypothetical protein